MKDNWPDFENFPLYSTKVTLEVQSYQLYRRTSGLQASILQTTDRLQNTLFNFLLDWG